MHVRSSAASSPSGNDTPRLEAKTRPAQARSAADTAAVSTEAVGPAPIHFAHIAAIETLSAFVRLGAVDSVTVVHHARCRSMSPPMPYASAGKASNTITPAADAAIART